MDETRIDALRARLEQERDALRAQLAEHGADPDVGGDLEVNVDGGFADSGQATAERAELIAVVEGLRGNLAEVEHALATIEGGDGYGTCERCGREIAAERLDAIPWARLCIDCKQKVG